MAGLILTKEEIQQDIEAYNQRLEGARLKLSALPDGVSDWKQRKKVQASRRALESEIANVRQILLYAADALRELNAACGALSGSINLSRTTNSGCHE